MSRREGGEALWIVPRRPPYTLHEAAILGGWVTAHLSGCVLLVAIFWDEITML